MPEKPPLGVTPKYIWDELRLEELSKAIGRCVEAHYVIPTSWIDEYNKLLYEKVKRQ